ncbi:uncharacterized protein TNCV_154051 [Trichonephila clavipes]|nr:uncharacterized protein TNCV_154051 [Trichonephila clavipes]
MILRSSLPVVFLVAPDPFFHAWVPSRVHYSQQFLKAHSDRSSWPATCYVDQPAVFIPMIRPLLNSLNCIAFLGFWTVKTVLNPISGQVFDEGHVDSGVLHSARWHDGDWLIDGIREAWLRCFVWMVSLKKFLTWLRV